MFPTFLRSSRRLHDEQGTTLPLSLSRDGILQHAAGRASSGPLDRDEEERALHAGTLRSYPRTLSSGAVDVRPVLSSVSSVDSGPLSLFLPSADTHSDSHTHAIGGRFDRVSYRQMQKEQMDSRRLKITLMDVRV